MDGEVVSAVDDGLFLVADLTRDDAWLGMHCRDAPVLAEYR